MAALSARGRWIGAAGVLGALALALLVVPRSRDEGTAVLELRGPTMGTRWSVQVRPAPAPEAARALEDAIVATLERINARMSTWDPDSEISRFNRSEGTGWFPLAGETWTVLREALDVAASTGGAFDVTVGPLVDLWGFGPRVAPGLPTPEELAAVRQRVGYGLLELRGEPPALRRRRPGVEVDLSAIAKGYAVDALAGVLREAGIEHFLVEIGGELRAAGRRSAGRPWRVAVERPDGSRAPQRILGLEDRAIATSGDYRNVVVLDGQRFSHTIDPLTGRPRPPGLASVSVLDASAMRADALATALMAMGTERARAWVEGEGLPALLLVRTDDGFEEHLTPAFERALAVVP